MSSSVILTLRPIVFELLHRGSFASCSTNCAQQGAAVLHNWLPRAIQYCGSQATAVPFCVANYYQRDVTKKLYGSDTITNCLPALREFQNYKRLSEIPTTSHWSHLNSVGYGSSYFRNWYPVSSHWRSSLYRFLLFQGDG